jgi:hypothetical protein
MDLLQFSLLDMTPYDKQSWFNLVASYYSGIWPMKIISSLFTIVFLLLIFNYRKIHLGSSESVRLTLLMLGAAWLWNGAVFHWQFFANLNWAAPVFGWVFIAQGVLLVLAAFFTSNRRWVSLDSGRGVLAIIVIFTGMLVYPLCGLMDDRAFFQVENFPLLPAPVTLVTFGVLMLLESRWRHCLVVVPILWAVVSGAFATTLGLVEFYFMAGAVAIWLLQLFIKKPL